MKTRLPDNFRSFRNKEDFMKFVSHYKGTLPKEEFICELCRNKHVLDIGCIDHSYETASSLGDNWLHKRLKDVSNSATGLDILGEDIKKLNEAGYNIIEANAESFELNKKFDVIVAGDIIEHVSNIGLFLSRIERHMHSKSICIITTPNPFNVEQFMLAIFDNYIGVNDEHVTWLDPRVMYETISRAGFEIVDFHWIKTRFKMPVTKRFCRFLADILSGMIMKKRPICRPDYAVILKKARR